MKRKLKIIMKGMIFQRIILEQRNGNIKLIYLNFERKSNNKFSTF
jgi:hypothetical protein